jgi:hypothetical protein
MNFMGQGTCLNELVSRRSATPLMRPLGFTGSWPLELAVSAGLSVTHFQPPGAKIALRCGFEDPLTSAAAFFA